MKVARILALFTFACTGDAGPIMPVIAGVAGSVIGPAASATVLTSGLAGLFGVGASGIWFGAATVTSVGLYYGTAAAAGALIAGGVGAGAGLAVVNGKGETKTISDPVSVSSALAEKASELSSYRDAKIASQESMSSKMEVAVMIASVSRRNKSLRSENARLYTATIKSASAAMSSAAKVSAFPTLSRKADEPLPSDFKYAVPKGVPEYEYRTCQNDLAVAGKDDPITFDIPSGYNLRIGNIPLSCMVVAAAMQPRPELGPHPVVTGVDSLEWHNVNHTFIDVMRKAYGLPPAE